MLDYDIQRLKDLDTSSVKVAAFTNEKNPNLEKYFLQYALKEDKSNKNAVYVVFDVNTKEIILYFSLRAGMVSDFSNDLLNLKLKKKVSSNSQSNSNEKLFKVPDIIPALELSYFCRNLGYSKAEEAKGIGAYIFHSEVYPFITKLKEFIGFKILFLYAADSTEDGTLVKYYKDKLGFSVADEEPLIPFQPMVDSNCKFMYQPI